MIYQPQEINLKLDDDEVDLLNTFFCLGYYRFKKGRMNVSDEKCVRFVHKNVEPDIDTALDILWLKLQDLNQQAHGMYDNPNSDLDVCPDFEECEFK
jgi:hypothetical protein